MEVEREDMLEAVVRPFVVAKAGDGNWSVEDGALELSLETEEGRVTEISAPLGRDVIGTGGCVEWDGARLRIEATRELLELVVRP